MDRRKQVQPNMCNGRLDGIGATHKLTSTGRVWISVRIRRQSGQQRAAEDIGRESVSLDDRKVDVAQRR